MLAEYHDYTFRLGHVTDNYENLFYGDKAQQIALIGVPNLLQDVLIVHSNLIVVPTLYEIILLK